MFFLWEVRAEGKCGSQDSSLDLCHNAKVACLSIFKGKIVVVFSQIHFVIFARTFVKHPSRKTSRIHLDMEHGQWVYHCFYVTRVDLNLNLFFFLPMNPYCLIHPLLVNLSNLRISLLLNG